MTFRVYSDLILFVFRAFEMELLIYLQQNALTVATDLNRIN